MPATPITAATRYIAPGTTKVLFLPTVAAFPGAPTSGEINAGTDLSGEVLENAGWSQKSDFLEVPALGTRFVPKISGMIRTDDASLTFYANLSGDDAADLFTRDQTGYVVWADSGLTSGNDAEVFQVTVSSVSRMRDATGGTANTVKVDFAIRAEPAVVALP